MIGRSAFSRRRLPRAGLLASSPCSTAVSRMFANSKRVLLIDSLLSATRRCPRLSRIGRRGYSADTFALEHLLSAVLVD